MTVPRPATLRPGRLRRAGAAVRPPARALRRAIARGIGLALLATLAAGVATGRTTDLAHSPITTTLAIALLAALLVRQLAARLRVHLPATPRAHPPLPALVTEIELAAGLVVATYTLLGVLGGPDSRARPLVYLFAAFAATFFRSAVAIGALALAATLDVGLAVSVHEPLADTAVHVAYLALFALAHLFFLRGELWRMRRDHEGRVGRALQAMRQDARDFRLIGTALSAESRARERDDERAKLTQSAVETIHQALFFTLELLRRTLDLTTCAVLWLDETGASLRIKELVTDVDGPMQAAIAADAGAPGAVLRERRAVHLAPPKRGHLPYYAEWPVTGVGAFLGVPIEDDGRVRGVLCADRATAVAFTEREEQSLIGATRQIVRTLESERVFATVERARYEHERFFRAADMLGKALTLQQVYETTFRAAREIVGFDFGAISLYDKETRRHTIQHVVGDAAPDLAGVSYADNTGLAAMAVKNKHYLPAGGELKDKEAPVFKAKIKLRGMESLLVMPLICADEAIGTLTLAAAARGAFPDDKREMLGVIATQVAFSVENAKMYRRMEEMATTDGLTGLLNHRTFQERFTEMLERAGRQRKPLTIVLTDIDHFKKVNDTYGHPTGDAVLKRVAQVLAANARKIDLVARYGGEEFALVLEDTDAQGARQLAERIRAEVQACELSSDKGPFHVTLSLGIASYPGDGNEKKELIAHADQCLYWAKEHGRNQAVCWSQVVAAKGKRTQAA